MIPPISLSSTTLWPLGLALIHFLWQGTVLAVVLLGLLRVIPSRAAKIRYMCACLTLVGMAVCFGSTFAILRGRSYSPPTLQSKIAAGSNQANNHSLEEQADPIPTDLKVKVDSTLLVVKNIIATEAAKQRNEYFLSWIVFAWITISLGMTFSHFVSLTIIWGRWQRSAKRVHGQWNEFCEKSAQRLGIKGVVTLLSSAQIHIPMTFGWLRPVVLMPTSILSGFPPEYVEAFLLHELAHIRRYDFIINLLLSVLEVPIQYHPATWWVFSQIQIAREHCCDDLSIEMLGERPTYIRALMELSDVRMFPSQFIAAGNGGNLSIRINRIMGKQLTLPSRKPFLSSVLGLSAFLLFTTFLQSDAKTNQNTVLEAALNSLISPTLHTPTSELNEYTLMANHVPCCSEELRRMIENLQKPVINDSTFEWRKVQLILNTKDGSPRSVDMTLPSRQGRFYFPTDWLGAVGINTYWDHKTGLLMLQHGENPECLIIHALDLTTLTHKYHVTDALNDGAAANERTTVPGREYYVTRIRASNIFQLEAWLHKPDLWKPVKVEVEQIRVAVPSLMLGGEPFIPLQTVLAALGGSSDDIHWLSNPASNAAERPIRVTVRLPITVKQIETLKSSPKTWNAQIE